jgi:chromosome segregation ATPase
MVGNGFPEIQKSTIAFKHTWENQMLNFQWPEEANIRDCEDSVADMGTAITGMNSKIEALTLKLEQLTHENFLVEQALTIKIDKVANQIKEHQQALTTATYQMVGKVDNLEEFIDNRLVKLESKIEVKIEESVDELPFDETGRPIG